jgi:hypothetical protein
MRDASIDWMDASVTPAIATTPTLHLELSDLVLGEDGAEPARLALDVAVPDALERLSIEGTVALDTRPSRGRQEIDWVIVAEGLRAGPLASYLPPGVLAEIEDGRLDARLRASLRQLADGGIGARLELGELAFRDGESEPFVALRAIRLNASRIDRKEILVEEIALLGLTARVERRANELLTKTDNKNLKF